MLLCLCMVMTMLPATALAAEGAPSAGEAQLVVYPGQEFSVTLEGTNSQSVTIGGYMDADDWYVTDGLVLMYDGIYNAGMNQHDSNASSWVELTGNVTATPISTTWDNGATVTDAALKLGNFGENMPTSFSNGFTLETAYTLNERMPESIKNTTVWVDSKDHSKGTKTQDSNPEYVSPINNMFGNSVMAFRPNNSPVLFYYNGDNWVASANKVWGHVPANKFLQYAMSTNADDLRKLYTAGDKQGEADRSTSIFEIAAKQTSLQLPVWSQYVDGTDFTIPYSERTLKPYSHVIHLIRMYDHQLSDSEMAQNAAVDKARYEDKTYQAPGTVKCGSGNAVVLTEYDFEKKAMATTLDSVSGNELTLTLNHLGKYTLTFQVGAGDPITKSVTVISEEEATAADAVSTQIKALPESSSVTAANLTAIGEAQNAYNSLSDIQKTRVGAENKAKLDACVTALDQQLAGNKTFTLTYDLCDDTSCPAKVANPNYTVTYKAEAATYTLDVPTRPNYTFLGWWYGDGQLTGPDGVSFGKWTTLSNATITARWQRTEGLGTETNPYSISSAEQWYALARILAKQPTGDADQILTDALKGDYALFAYTKDYKDAYTALQTAHYDLTGNITLKPENGYIGVPNFKGVFDGGNHTVTLDYDKLNFTTDKATYFGGLFSSAQEATIKNLTLAGSVKGTYTAAAGLQDIGLLVGYTTPSASGSTMPLLIENVTSNVTVDLIVDVNGTATAYVASMVGRGNSAAAPACLTLNNCVNNGNITVTYQNAASNTGRAAGLIGHAYNGAVLTKCVNNGDVTHKGTDRFWTGGMLGTGAAAYTGCVQAGNITSDISAVIPFCGLTADENAGNILKLTVTGTKGQQVRHGTQSVTLADTGTAVIDVPVYRNSDNLVENNAFSYGQYLTVNGTRLDWFNLTNTKMNAKLNTTEAADLTVPFQSASDALILTKPEQLLALQDAINEGNTYAIDTLYTLGGRAVPNDYTAARIALQTAYYQMGSDIDLSNTENFTGIGSSSFPFGGHFDGKGYTITYSIAKTDCAANRIGLFGQIGSVGGSDPEIRNLTVDAAISLTSQTYQNTTFCIGGLAGSVSNAPEMSGVQVNVKGISVTPNVSGVKYDTYHIGGVFGQGSVENADVTISGNITGSGNGIFYVSGVTNNGSVGNCTVTFESGAAEISATSEVTIADCAAILNAYSDGVDISLSNVKIRNNTGGPIAVKAVGKDRNTGRAGGLLGNLTSATATSDTWLRVDGTVTVDGDFEVAGGARAGGLCGEASNAYSVSVDGYVNTMKVSCENGYAGGMFGSVNPSSDDKKVVLHDCLNAGAVIGNYRGGLIGNYNDEGTLELSGCAYLKTDGMTAVRTKEDDGAAALNLSVFAGQKTFGDTASLFGGETLPALSIAPADAFALTDAGEVTFTKVGTHNATLNWNDSSFYTSGDITVTDKTLTTGDVTVTGVNSAYTSDDAAKAALETVEVTYDGKVLVKGTDYTVEQVTSGSSHKLVITFRGNYRGSADAAYTVSASTLNVSAQSYTGVYDGAEHSISVTAVPAEGVTVTYGDTEGSLSSTNPAYANVGTHVVYWKAEKDGSAVTGSAVVSITPATITITPNDKTAYVGDALPVLGKDDYTVTGLLGEDTLKTAPKLSYDGTPNMNTAGTYDITASGADAGKNYKITYGVGTLTVSRHSSGGGSDTPTYAISAPADVANGSVSISPKNASKGSTVTITVKPDEGYVLDELIVTDKSGNTVKLTDKGNGKYTFTMPGSKVTVKAAFTESGNGGANPFVDVVKDAYYYDAVAWAVENGITSGTSATTFSPDMVCTRAQMATFLWRAAGSPAPKNDKMPFADVSVNAYYHDAVLWAVENGITSGTGNNSFSPDAVCTRGQMATFLYRFEGTPAVSGGNPFSDVPADAYYTDAVTWAVEKGITVGTGNDNFSPNADCTRGQMVTFLYRCMGK